MRSVRQKKDPVFGIFELLYSFYGPQGWWPADTCLEIMVGAILTQNTAWTNVEKAIENLKRSGAVSSTAAIKDIRFSKLSGLIKPAGYHNVKSRRLKNFIRFVFKKYNGDLSAMAGRSTSDLREELLSVNGIGPETCDSMLLYAFGRPVFVVDAYTRRIFSRHGFFPKDSSYAEMRGFFEGRIPPDERIYNEYHALIVRLGKDFCRSVPRCEKCPLKTLQK